MRLKILMIGNSGVGKTSILLRYTNNIFSPTFITTIGIDFRTKTVNIDNTDVKLQLWDTAGQERFRAITTSYFRGAQAVALVYDVSNRKSFNDVKEWMNSLHQHADKKINIMLLANKCDVHNKEVSDEEGRLLAQSYNVPWFGVSAKTGACIDEAFMDLGVKTYERLNKQFEGTNTIRLTNSQKTVEKKRCC